jgi:hypothetical protein
MQKLAKIMGLLHNNLWCSDLTLVGKVVGLCDCIYTRI